MGSSDTVCPAGVRTETAGDEEIAAALRALSERTRLRLFLMLREGEACVCELAGALGLAGNLVSHHLGVLRRAGLVRDRRDASDARWVYYQLDDETLGRLAPAFGALFDARTIGTRTPVCGPVAIQQPLLVPRRAEPTGAR
jgi:ArsR family transcriptional regulator, arsenate/arsenite/antimonite-responsive transcriptional repressor